MHVRSVGATHWGQHSSYQIWSVHVSSSFNGSRKRDLRHRHREALDNDIGIEGLEDVLGHQRLVDAGILVLVQLGQVALPNVHHLAGVFVEISKCGKRNPVPGGRVFESRKRGEKCEDKAGSPVIALDKGRLRGKYECRSRKARGICVRRIAVK
jgi:hypothetical protein